jgi:tetratricopeptide (TPR) repeat protein
MPRRLFTLAAVLLCAASTLRAETPGAQSLALGRQALARQDYRAAAEHLTAATASLDPQKEREALAEAWLQLGVADLAGLDRAEDSLAAFLKSAEISANPSSAWLWASTAAEKLGRTDEARQYKMRALGPTLPEKTVQAVPSPEPENIPGPTPPTPPVQPAEEKKPDAFQHFFGPKEPAAPAAPPAAQTAPSAPVKKGDAFQHLFSESSPERPAGAREAQQPAKKPAEKPKEKAGTPKVDAFQHFFGEKKDKKAEDKSREEKTDDGPSDSKTQEDNSNPPPLS